MSSSPAGQPRRRLHIWDIGREASDPSEASRSSVADAVGDSAHSAICETDEALHEAYAQALGEAPQPIELEGLCQLPNGIDRSCRTRTIGPQSVDVVYQDTPSSSGRRRAEENLINGTVHLDLEQVGKFHGVLTAQAPDGFHVAVDPHFGGLLLTKLARYMASGLPQQAQRGNLGECSPSERIIPTSSVCTYRDEEGVLYKGTLINISRLDAVVKIGTRPELNSLITFCGRRQRKAHVIRRYQTGFSALFVDPLRDQEFSADIQLTDDFSTPPPAPRRFGSS